jgi:energy-coupling factor transport system substrate-specific component
MISLLSFFVVTLGIFLSPFFFFRSTPGREFQGMSLVFSLILFLFLPWLVSVAQQQWKIRSTFLVLLGMFCSLSSLFRMIPLPLGMSAGFFLPVLSGYAFGPHFGILVGILSMLVSSIFLGAIGPWLPYQLIAMGWVGGMAGFGSFFRNRFHNSFWELILLCWIGGFSGILYGLLINLWFWPFLSSGLLPYQGMQIFHEYLIFYGITSLWWDVFSGVGNVVLMVLFSKPLMVILLRFEKKFQFQNFSTGISLSK